MKRILALVGTSFLTGCTPGVQVHEPTSVRPAAVARAPQANGAIFQDQVSYRPLFEDHRARLPGDTLTVLSAENIRYGPTGEPFPKSRSNAKRGFGSGVTGVVGVLQARLYW